MFKIILMISFLYSLEKQTFKVEFLGFQAAMVELDVLDTLYDNKKNKIINFQAQSSGLVNYIFNVNNKYSTIVREDLKTILSFSKDTMQPNLENSLKTISIDNKIIYDNSKIEIPNNHFNIFSLLYFLSMNKIMTTKNINIEREGELYSGIITPISTFNNNTILYELDLIKRDAINNNSIIKNTDIFTWALFKKNSTRRILVDYNKNSIVECIFKNGTIKMFAKNIKYYK